MIERVIAYSVRNRFLVITAALALVAYGIYSLARTPIDAIPDLSENQVIVFADWMGRSPQEIEDQVTYPLSVNLQGLAGVKAVRSTSEFGFSMVNVIFEDDVGFYFARERVLERLSVAATWLPPGVVPYLAPDATALGQIFWYTVEGEGYDLGELRAIQDWFVRYQLNTVPGVAQVSSAGGFVRSYEIAVDPERLRGYGVTLGQLAEAVGRSNTSVGGNVFVQGDAEVLVRGVGWVRTLDDLRNVVLAVSEGVPVTVGQVASVQFAPEPRRSALEKDGREAVGGVVLMRHGENPLAVTERIHRKLEDLQSGLPPGVRIVPFYDRTRLIHDAIHTLKRTLTEEMIVATIAILLILNHLGSAFVVVVTLPLSVLVAFILMRAFHIPSNIMSLSGIAISIGVLVDAAIVMVENATHELREQFGPEPVRGDTREAVIRSCRLVGRPIFFSILIMLLSFLPVFALSGMEGKMFHPLAFTKSFAMIGVAVLSITLVPALLPVFLRGRLRSELENPIVRGFIEVYRPVLAFLMRHPKPFVWSFALLLGIGWSLAGRLGREFMPPLDEGSVMDMPVTVPSVSMPRAAADLAARNAVLRSFPEVEQVVGKAGRADTPTDPAPPDMVETIVNLRPRSWWPRRQVGFDTMAREAAAVLELMETRGAIRPPPDDAARAALLNETAMDAASWVDQQLRAAAAGAQQGWEQEMGRELVAVSLARLADRGSRSGFRGEAPAGLADSLAPAFGGIFAKGAGRVEVGRFAAAAADSLVARGVWPRRPELARRAGGPGAALAQPLRTLLGRDPPGFEESLRRELDRERAARWKERTRELDARLYREARAAIPAALVHALAGRAEARGLAPRPVSAEDLAEAVRRREEPLRRKLLLRHKTKEDLLQEMDSALQVPGWGNIWTQPIINRVDMLATGVRTMVGVKVFGDDLREIQRISQEVAEVLRGIPGAVDVFPDQVVGENYLEIEVDRERAARYGVNVADVFEVVETALGGMTVGVTVEGRRRFPIRIRYARDFREDVGSVGRLLIAARAGAGGGEAQIPLSALAEIRLVEGPSMIKSENGLLRSYVQLNVRERDVVGFVEEAERAVRERVALPSGFYLEWSGQFEHQVRARRTLQLVFPAVVAVIFLILYLTFHDLAHAGLMVLAVPGALVGGVIFQTIFGYNFSVAVWVGYIAAFGMATETGIVMMVYLREAIARRGGLAAMRSEEEITAAVMEGAVHRLRPKLLTEGVAIVGLMPMLWAHGTGAEVMRPMVAPVLGGLLVADEVIDLLLPVLFHAVETRRWRRGRVGAASS